jgi:hypothetical protein
MNPVDKPIAREWAILLVLAGVQISLYLANYFTWRELFSFLAGLSARSPGAVYDGACPA